MKKLFLTAFFAVVTAVFAGAAVSSVVSKEQGKTVITFTNSDDDSKSVTVTCDFTVENVNGQAKITATFSDMSAMAGLIPNAYLLSPGESPMSLADGVYTGTTVSSYSAGQTVECTIKRIAGAGWGDIIFPITFVMPGDTGGGDDPDPVDPETASVTVAKTFDNMQVIGSPDKETTEVSLKITVAELAAGKLKVSYDFDRDYVGLVGFIDVNGSGRLDMPAGQHTSREFAGPYTSGQELTIRPSFNDPGGARYFTPVIYVYGQKEIVDYPMFTMVVDTENITVTSNSISVPYTLECNRTDLPNPEAWVYDAWLSYDGKDTGHENTRSGTITVTGLQSNTTYNLYQKAHVVGPNGYTENVTNNDTPFAVKTAVAEGAPNFSVNITNIAADFTTYAFDYDFVSSNPDFDLTGYTFEVYFDLGEGKKTETFTTKSGHVVIDGLTRGTNYSFWEHSAVKDANGSPADVTTYNTKRDFITRDYARPSITYTDGYKFTPTSATTGTLAYKVVLSNPDNMAVSSIRFAAAGAPGDAVAGVDYDHWTNGDIIWGQTVMTGPAAGEINVTIQLANLPEGRTTNLWMKSEITPAEGAAFESAGAGAWQADMNAAPAAEEIEVVFDTPLNISNRSMLATVSLPADVDATVQNYTFKIRRAVGPQAEGENDGWTTIDVNPASPIINYTGLTPTTDYEARVEFNGSGSKEGRNVAFTGAATYAFTTAAQPVNTFRRIVDGYFDGKKADGDDSKFPAAVDYTITYVEAEKALYVTPVFDINTGEYPGLVASLTTTIADSSEATSLSTGHVQNTFKIALPEGAGNDTGVTLHTFGAFAEGGMTSFPDVDYQVGDEADDFIGEPKEIAWEEADADNNINVSPLRQDAPVTRLAAYVRDDNGHLLHTLPVEYTITEVPENMPEGHGIISNDNTLDFTATGNLEVHYVNMVVTATHTPAQRAAALSSSRYFTYSHNGSVTAINEITADDANAPVRFYTLSGVEIERPVAGQTVIMLRGGKATKILVK